MIVDYFKDRPNLAKKYYKEADLVYWLVQLGKEEEALNYLEILIDDLISGGVQSLFLNSRYGIFEKGNLFDLLCLSENETTAQKATDLLFHLLTKKEYETYYLHALTTYLDKERHDNMLDHWYAYYSSLDFSNIDIAELEKNGWAAVKKSVPECNQYENFMSSNWRYLCGKYGAKYWEERYSKSVYIEKKNNFTFEDSQLNCLEILFRMNEFTKVDLQRILFEAVKTEKLFLNYSERYLQLVSMAYPDRHVPKADFDRLQLDKLLPYSSPLEIKAKREKKLPPALVFDEEKIKLLVDELNSIAVACNFPEIKLNKLLKFLISKKGPYGVIYDFLHANSLLIGFYPEDGSVPTNYVELFDKKFAHVVKEQGYPFFEIGQVTESVNENDYKYNIFVKFKNSIYQLEYTEEGTNEYTDMQRLVKQLNLCLIDNKETKRFIGVESEAFLEFVLIEPALVKQLSKKYKLGFFAIDEEDEYRRK